jgi:hypothetical protein
VGTVSGESNSRNSKSIPQPPARIATSPTNNLLCMALHALKLNTTANLWQKDFVRGYLLGKKPAVDFFGKISS